jgi:hypothetical protein
MDATPPESGPLVYQIRVKGHLAPDWAEWFDGMTISNEAQGEAVLSGPVRDQAALYGLIAKIRDLGLLLIAVNRAEHESKTKHNMNSA